MFAEYAEYSCLISDRVIPLIEKQVLPDTTRLLFDEQDKAIKRDSQLVLLGSGQHETARRLANLPHDVQFDDAEILIISRSDSDFQSDLTKTKRIFIPDGAGH